MPRRTEQDKVLMLSKLEEDWSIRRVATHNGLNKNTVLQVISKEKVGEQEGTASRRPIIIFLITVNVIFNLISKLAVHTAYILQNRCYFILNVYAKVLKASIHNLW
jgi:hypothetical protein